MSKNHKYRNIAPEDLIRYTSNGLTDEERHALERETQKDPFTEEALEGFSSLNANQAKEGLSRLRSRLDRRVSGRRSAVWVGIAASIAVILTLGTLYFTVFTEKLGKLDQTVAESESAKPGREKGASEEFKIQDEAGNLETLSTEDPAKDVVLEDAIVPGRVYAAGENAEKDDVLEPEGRAAEQVEGENEIEPAIPVMEPVTSEAMGQAGEAGGAETGIVVADEIIIAEEESQSNDSFLMVEMEESEEPEDLNQARQLQGAMADEGDAPGTRAVAKKESSARSAVAVSSVEMLPDSVPALPLGGMELFNRYIEENIRIPGGDLLQADAVVVLTFSINGEGRPEKIEIEESPGDDFSREATRLIQEGPAWSPAFQDGRPLIKRNRLKIKFTLD